MPTATESPKQSHGTSTDHIKRFEKRVHAMRSAFSDLPSDDSFETLLGYIHQPGWTTPAEAIFFETMVESITTQAQQMAQTHQQLMAASAVVGR